MFLNPTTNNEPHNSKQRPPAAPFWFIAAQFQQIELDQSDQVVISESEV